MFVLLFLIGCKPAPIEGVVTDSPCAVGRTTSLGEFMCEVDVFTYEGHTCLRWLNGRGSDMECWENP